MTFFTTTRARHLKLALAGALTVLAAGLAVTDRMLEAHVPQTPPVPRTSGAIDAVIDSLLVRHHLDLKNVRSWSVRTPEKTTLRRESRIDVPPSFVSLVFNHDLQNEVMPLGARVIATEHSKEQTVTMHVRRDGLIIRTLVFRTIPAPPAKRTKAVPPVRHAGRGRTTSMTKGRPPQ